jgi:hypothetical protein
VAQFRKFEFSKLLDEFHFLRHNQANPKTKLMTDLRARYDILYFIGDTTSDRDACQENNILFLALESGFSNIGEENHETFININYLLTKMISEHGK